MTCSFLQSVRIIEYEIIRFNKIVSQQKRVLFEQVKNFDLAPSLEPQHLTKLCVNKIVHTQTKLFYTCPPAQNIKHNLGTFLLTCTILLTFQIFANFFQSIRQPQGPGDTKLKFCPCPFFLWGAPACQPKKKTCWGRFVKVLFGGEDLKSKGRLFKVQNSNLCNTYNYTSDQGLINLFIMPPNI